ncbi:MAG: segregation/condensation protein A [Ignavibacteria bacterium]|nr:segregation/condensation protein A [Ignavibacteria bacterium]
MYKIKLQHFEGPLDLLLFFIKRDELDICDIPISKITKDFIEYIKILEQLDLEVAGDFILMAATLMQIKVKMLLPKEVDDSGDEIDPRADLVKALLEYKRYKEMSEEFSYLESSMRNYQFRGNNDYDEKEKPIDLDVLLKNITLYDLIKAFKKAILDRPAEPFHEIKKWNVTIDEQIEYITNKLEEKRQISFIELMKDMANKIRIVVTFIAMLELVKAGKIGLRESNTFNDFIIYGLANG